MVTPRPGPVSSGNGERRHVRLLIPERGTSVSDNAWGGQHGARGGRRAGGEREGAPRVRQRVFFSLAVAGGLGGASSPSEPFLASGASAARTECSPHRHQARGVHGCPAHKPFRQKLSVHPFSVPSEFAPNACTSPPATCATSRSSSCANYAIQHDKHPFRILDEGLAPEEYGIGFRKSDAALADEVWSTLLEMAADGTIRRISEKWFGSDLSLIPGFYAKATHGGGRGRRNK